MAAGGKRPGAGRKAGAKTKRTQQIVAKAAAEGITPLEYMLGILRDETQDPAARFKAAESAAPYIHPRLSSVDSTVKSDNVTHIISDQPPTAEEWEKQYGGDLATPAGSAEGAG